VAARPVVLAVFLSDRLRGARSDRVNVAEGEAMPTVSNSININAPVEKVFAYVTDPMNLPEWMHHMKAGRS
jgi:uncharacterized membrane protein